MPECRIDEISRISFRSKLHYYNEGMCIGRLLSREPSFSERGLRINAYQIRNNTYQYVSNWTVKRSLS